MSATSITIRVAHAGVLSALTLAAVLPAQPHTVNWSPPKAQPPYEVTIAQQVAEFACPVAPKGRIPSGALLVDAHPVAGGVSIGAVVTHESFDAAFAGAKAGRVWIIRWCR